MKPDGVLNSSFTSMEFLKNSTHNEIARDNITGKLTLKELNDEAAKIYYGSDILFGILILPGVIGNLHVLHIYINKKANNNSRVFIIFLAFIDLLTCGVILPFNIVNCLLPYMYYDDASCKFFTFLNAFVTIGSAYALLVIAVERYRKICAPFKAQITLKYAKVSCIGVVILTSVYSLPTVFLFGSTRIPTFQPGSFGYECHYLTEIRNTQFQYIFTGFNLVFSLITCVIMIILYSFVGMRLWKQHKKIERSKTNFSCEDLEKDAVAVEGSGRRTNSLTNDSGLSESGNDIVNQPGDTTANVIIGPLHQSVDAQHINRISSNAKGISLEINSRQNSEVEIPTKIDPVQKSNEKLEKAINVCNTKQLHKTSFIFFLITLFYLVSYLPFPILRTYQIRNMDWYEGLDFTDLVAFHTTFGTLYISNVVNPFIYIACDRHFRQEVKTFYLKIFRRPLL